MRVRFLVSCVDRGVTIVFIFAGRFSEYGYRRFVIYSSDDLLKGDSYIGGSLVSCRG